MLAYEMGASCNRTLIIRGVWYMNDKYAYFKRLLLENNIARQRKGQEGFIARAMRVVHFSSYRPSLSRWSSYYLWWIRFWQIELTFPIANNKCVNRCPSFHFDFEQLVAVAFYSLGFLLTAHCMHTYADEGVTFDFTLKKHTLTRDTIILSIRFPYT